MRLSEKLYEREQRFYDQMASEIEQIFYENLIEEITQIGRELTEYMAAYLLEQNKPQASKKELEKLDEEYTRIILEESLRANQFFSSEQNEESSDNDHQIPSEDIQEDKGCNHEFR